MSDELLKQYHDLINDTWKLLKTHSDPDGSDEYWESVANEASALFEKHHDTDPEFAKRIIVETVKVLQRVYREKEAREEVA